MRDTGLYHVSKPEYVPQIGDELLARMRAHIQPCILNPNRRALWKIKNADRIDLRLQSFLWGANEEGDPMTWSTLDHTKIVSFHTFGAPGLFKPTLAECYAAIARFLPHNWRHVRWMAIEQMDGAAHQRIFEPCHLATLHLFGESVGTIAEINERNRLLQLERAKLTGEKI